LQRPPSCICVVLTAQPLGLVWRASLVSTLTTHLLIFAGTAHSLQMEVQTTSEVAWHLSHGAPGRAQASHTPALPPVHRRRVPNTLTPPLCLVFTPLTCVLILLSEPNPNPLPSPQAPCTCTVHGVSSSRVGASKLSRARTCTRTQHTHHHRE
jgi:hypothetical protein